MDTRLITAKRSPSNLLVGRGRERRLLKLAIEAAVSNPGRCVLVQGEPGIGKSSLLRGAVEDAPCKVLFASCLPGWRVHPFAALLDVLGETPLAPASNGGGDLARAQAVRDRIEEACRNGPTVLALDDAHWADDPSLRVLRQLTSRLDELPLVLALAMRSHDVPDELARLTARLAAHGRLTRVVLGPLDESDVERLAETLVGDLPDSALLDELTLAGGNPLHIADIVEASQHERFAGYQDDLEAEAEPTAPTLPKAPRPHELAHLSPATWDMLSLAALLGGTFSVRELCETLGRPMTDLLPAVREAVGAGVLVGVGANALGFAQDELRAALDTDLPAAVRAELHRDIADRLERAEMPATVVAAHLAQGAAQPADLDWVRRLAARILPQEPATAARLWRRLRSSMPEGDPRQSACDSGLATSLLAAGDFRRAELTARRALVTAAEPGVVGSLWLTLSESLMRQRRLAAARAAAESARADVRVVPFERAEQLSVAAVSAALAGDVAVALEAADRAEAAAGRSGHPRARARALAVRAHCAHLDGAAGLGLALLVEAARADVLRGPDPSESFTRIWHAFALTDLDRVGEAHAVLGAAEAAARAANATAALRDTTAGWAAVLVAEGSLQRASDALEEYALLGPAVVEPDVVAAARRSWVTHQRNGPKAAAPWTAKLAGSLDSALGCHGAAWPYLALAAEHVAAEDTTGALRVLAEGWDACTAFGPTMELVTIGPELAALASACGEPERASVVADRLSEIAARNPDVASLEAAALTVQGFAASDADMLLRALRTWQRSPRRLEAARVGEHVARTLVVRGELGLADPIAAEAVRGFVECGATYAAQRLRMIRPGSAGATVGPQRRPVGRWDALTRTERIVATYVEQGESNSEIAARLVVSRRTVESHVSHILAKLGLKSRSELIVAAVRRQP